MTTTTKVAYADHPTRGWLLIPPAWFQVFRNAGATLYAAPAGTKPVDRPTPVTAGPPSGLTALEEDGGALKGPSSVPPSSASDDLTAEEKAALREQYKLAAEMARQHPEPSSPRHETFIRPNFAVELGAPKRCSSCREYYPPPPRGDTGVCRSCQRAGRAAG